MLVLDMTAQVAFILDLASAIETMTMIKPYVIIIIASAVLYYSPVLATPFCIFVLLLVFLHVR